MASESIGDQLSALEETFDGASEFTSSFRIELQAIRAELEGTDKETRRLSSSLGSSLKSAFQSVVFDGAKVSDVLLKIGRDMAGNVFSQALKPVQNAIGSGLGSLVTGGMNSLLGGILPFADGGVIGSGRVRAFANGGIVNGPVSFPMRGGVGLMGEAGPEAIMPLARGPDGKLGVRGGSGGGGGAINVTMNISTPDAAGFRRSRTQVAAEMSRALQRSRRNL